MTHELYQHLDLSLEYVHIKELLVAAAGIAFHADADGTVSAVLACQIGPGDPVVRAVGTEDFDFIELADWVKDRARHLITLDINVLSQDGALARLAAAVAGQLLVLDDHHGAPQAIPGNVDLRTLLPPSSAHSHQIYPTSLMLHAALSRATGATERNDFLAVAAAYGEGVRDRFRRYLPRLERRLERLARATGRGINAYFTATDAIDRAPFLVGALVDFARSERPIDVDSGEVSAWLEPLTLASDDVDAQVRSAVESASGALSSADSGIPVFGVEVTSSRRIVNLVASSLRSSKGEGVSVAWQRTPRGVAFEARRARDLDHPDLAAILVAMPEEYFVARGGHPMAAGATVHSEGFEPFLREFLRRGNCATALIVPP